MRIREIRTGVGAFKPMVTVSGYTLTVAEAELTFLQKPKKVAQASFTFSAADLGKYLYWFLVESGGTCHYDLVVSDPAAPQLPFAKSGTELFPCFSGQVVEGGLEVEVRHFLPGESHA